MLNIKPYEWNEIITSTSRWNDINIFDTQYAAFSAVHIYVYVYAHAHIFWFHFYASLWNLLTQGRNASLLLSNLMPTISAFNKKKYSLAENMINNTLHLWLWFISDKSLIWSLRKISFASCENSYATFEIRILIRIFTLPTSHTHHMTISINNENHFIIDKAYPESCQVIITRRLLASWWCRVGIYITY